MKLKGKNPAKSGADERWSEKIFENNQERSKNFWKQIKKAEDVINSIKNLDGNKVQNDKLKKEGRTFQGFA